MKNRSEGEDDTIHIENNATFYMDTIMLSDYDLDGDEIEVTEFKYFNDSLIVPIKSEGLLEIDILDEWCGVDSIQYTNCDEFGFCDEAYIYISIDCYYVLTIPEGFSPDGDVVNDEFEIGGIEFFPNSNIQIFNSWGRLVYKKDSYLNEWDVLSLGKNSEEGKKLQLASIFL